MLAQLKLILGMTSDDRDELLNFVLESVEDQVKNYCNITEIPAALERVIVRMAADLYRLEGYGAAAGEEGAVTQVKRGDVTTTFGSTGGNYNTMTGAGGADFLKNYTAQLNAFRKLRR